MKITFKLPAVLLADSQVEKCLRWQVKLPAATYTAVKPYLAPKCIRVAGQHASGCYERSHLGLSHLGCWHDRQRTPLQDWDPSGNDPRLVSGSLHQRSGKLSERFRTISVSVGSREVRLTWTEHPRCGTLSC